MNHNFNILHFHQDTRGDEGDDAGYTVSISEKDGLYYVHIFFISANNNEGNYWIITNEENENRCGYPDFRTFNSVDECQVYINSLVKELKEMYDDIDLDWDDYDDLKGNEKLDALFIQTIYNVFIDYPEKEVELLTNLSKSPYKKKYIGDFEWIEDSILYDEY